MAVIHTTFTNLTDFQASLDIRGSASTAVSNTFFQASASFDDFGSAFLEINPGASNTHATGTVLGTGGTFVADGNNLFSPNKQITRLQYSVGGLDMSGSIAANGPSPFIISSFGGSATRVEVNDVTLRGTIGANNLLFGNQTFKLTSFTSSDLTFSGSINYSAGIYGGTVSTYALEGATGSITAGSPTAPLSVSFLTLAANNAGDIMAAMLAGNDQIFGDGIDQVLDGYGGNDSIIAGDDNDTLNGGAGNDTLNGGAGVDEINGNEGNDVILINAAAHHAVGETIDGGDGTADIIRFTATGGQSLVLNAGVQNVEQVVLTSLTGDLNINASAVTSNGLIITGNNGANVITGTGEADSLSGSGGSDELNGLAGNDTLNGGLGIDTMNGGDGDDLVLIGSGEHPLGEAIDGGDGTNDTIRFTSTTSGQVLVLQNVSNVENVAIANAAGVATGTAALGVNASSLTQNVMLTGNAGANILIAGSGNDTLIGGAGADNLQGGFGDDRIEIAATSHLPATEAINGGGDEDSLVYTGTTAGLLTLTNKFVGMEVVEITGTAAVNVNAATVANGLRIFGNDGANSLTGTAFGDTISGGAGNDSITGGAGVDDLQGGADDDSFFYASAAHLSASESVDGGSNINADTVHFTATTTAGGATLTLGTNFTSIEKVVIGTPAGTVALNIDAALAPNGLSITGNAGKNTLTGTGFNDTLTGGGGADSIQGGDGNDTVVAGSVAEYVGDIINGGLGIDDRLHLGSPIAATFVLNANLSGIEIVAIGAADGNMSGTTAINVDASAIAGGLTVWGNSGANRLTGGAGNDDLRGMGGNDVIVGGAGDDNLYGFDGSDVFLIASGAHHQDGEGISGHAGGVGPGSGDVVRFTSNVAGDTLTLSSLVNQITEVEASDAAGNNTGTAALNIDASNAPGFDGFTVTGNAGANALTGTAENDIINGNAGNDTLVGGIGNDTLNGGAGIDTADYSGAAAGLGTGLAGGEDGDGGFDTLTSIEKLIGSNFNDTLSGGSLNDVLDGGGGTDILLGDAGSDTLIGGAGNDALSGGEGNDVFLIGEAEHDATETLDGGGSSGDVVRFTSTTHNDTLTLHAINLEQVIIGSAAGVMTGITRLHVDASNADSVLLIAGNNGANALTGNDLANAINGNGGDDTLTGGAGNDVLNGGANVDTANYSGAGAGVLVNLAIGRATQDGDGFADTLVAIENVTGSAFDDTLTGNAGNNVLAGGGGNDSLNGGAGIDTADYSNAAGGVVVDLLVGSAELGGGNDSLALFENITGSAHDDTLIGNAGANVLDGGLGNDSMTGGAGNDTYFLSQDGETVTEGAGAAQGVDTVVQRNMTFDYVLAANVENLTILASESGWAASGNDLNNLVRDGSGSGLHLSGGTGKDTLIGGVGDDTYVLNVMNGATLATGDLGDVLVEAANQGTDSVHLRGNSTAQTITFILPAQIERVFVFSDMVASTVTLTGNALDNELSAVSMPGGSAMLFDGGAGNDIVLGGLGHDNLKGGTGNDALEGRSGNDTLTGGAGTDSLLGNAGEDLFLFGALAEMPATEIVDGGEDTDTLRYTGGAATLTLGTLAGQINLTSIEAIQIAGATGAITGAAAINVNAANYAGPLSISGNNGANMLTGTASDDTLTGNGGNDTLVGGAGSDTMDGGAGDDVFLFGSADEYVGTEIVTGGAGRDVIRITSTAPAALQLFDDVTVEEVVILGAFSFDLNAGVAGPLSIIGNNASNSIFATAQNDTINGNGGDDNLNGNAGNDNISGGAGNDNMSGGAGNDTLQGGLGNDTYSMHGDDIAELVIEGVNQGTDTVDINGASGAVSYTLRSNFENASLTNLGDFAGTLIGNALNNLLLGNSEGAGTFFFDGGAGNDQLTAGQDSSAGGADTLLGGAGNDTLSAGHGQDSVNGGDGNDRVVMYVSAGNADNADGGTGTSDTLVLSDSLVGGQVTVDLTLADQISQIGEGVGNDSVLQQKGFEHIDASGMTGGNLIATGNNLANYLIGTGVVDTLAGGEGNDTLEGGEGIDTLNGDAGNDSLDGGGGDDVMTGGAGNDTYRLDSAGDQVTEDSLPGSGTDTIIHEAAPEPYTLPDNVENLDVLLFTSEEGAHAEGNALNNIIRDLSSFANGVSLSGLAGNDLLFGGVGQNFLSGGTGKDTLMGGAGNDTYNWSLGDSDAGDLLIEAANQGTDNVNLNGSAGLANFTFVLPTNIENALLFNMGDKTGTLTGNVLNNGLSALNGTAIMSGGAGNDSLNGSGGNDTLTGGTGVDSILGGAGNDVFVIGAGSEHLGSETMNGGDGSDVIRFTSGVNGDKLILTNNVSDIEQVVIVTPAGSAAGTTTLEVNAAAALDSLEIFGNNGANKLTGTAFDDSLTGNGGNDILIGGAGNDTLLGGSGADNQTGGLGDDVFRLTTLAEFATGELINGEAGNDMLQLTGTGLSLNLVSIANNRITGIEVVDLTGSGNNTLSLNVSDVLDLSFETNTLRVDGNGGDVVNSSGQGWVADPGNPETIGAHEYNRYTFGAATLLIDTDIAQTNVT